METWSPSFVHSHAWCFFAYDKSIPYGKDCRIIHAALTSRRIREKYDNDHDDDDDASNDGEGAEKVADQGNHKVLHADVNGSGSSVWSSVISTYKGFSSLLFLQSSNKETRKESRRASAAGCDLDEPMYRRARFALQSLLYTMNSAIGIFLILVVAAVYSIGVLKDISSQSVQEWVSQTFSSSSSPSFSCGCRCRSILARSKRCRRDWCLRGLLPLKNVDKHLYKKEKEKQKLDSICAWVFYVWCRWLVFWEDEVLIFIYFFLALPLLCAREYETTVPSVSKYRMMKGFTTPTVANSRPCLQVCFFFSFVE